MAYLPIMEIMVSIKSPLTELGLRLRTRRLEKNETQARFAARLGVSVPTLRKMEQGEASCTIGHWLQALVILGAEQDMDWLLHEPASLFEQAEIRQLRKTRKRARP
jgi:transcriptional regulator with XRE-family HTH domain